MRRIIIIGGGTAGLAAAYTLKKRGLEAIVLEANDRAGGRLGGDRAAGFSIDEGADFFTPTHDIAIRMCEAFGIRLIPMAGDTGWYWNGRLTVPYAGSEQMRTLAQSLPMLQMLGIMAPATPGVQSFMKLVETVEKHSEYLSFASDSRLAEVDGNENAAEYLTHLGIHEELMFMIRAFFKMTMAPLEKMGAMYALTYLSQIMMNIKEVRVPETGIGSLGRAMAESCGNALRVSSPVQRVIVENGTAMSVVLDDGPIEADAVICATTATKALEIIPDLPEGIRGALRKVTYSRGCRVVIGLDYHPLPAGLHGVMHPEEDAPLLLDRSISLPASAPPGKASLDLVVGGDRAAELFPLEDQEIKRALLRDARQLAPPDTRLPDDDEGLFTRVYRWREAVCLAPPGMLKAMATMQREHAREVRNLFLAGDYMRVPSTNGAMTSGIDAAEQAAQFMESCAP